MGEEAAVERQLDAVIVGAGFAGLYMAHRLRALDIQVFEAGADVGGTWYWNRYPGARCDVPSIEYSFSFDAALEQEWDWREAMAAQPEILEYANHVAERYDLRQFVQFDTRVTAATFDEEEALWRIETDRGDRVAARYCIMATGCLSVPNTPRFEGAERFAGEVYHTGRWPHEEPDFTGKRVGIIGTGSSGVQAIPVIAETAGHLTVFQRTPVYTVPAYNRPLTDAYRNDVKAHYREIRDAQRASPIGISAYGMRAVGQTPTPQNILDLTAEELRAKLDETGLSGLLTYADIRTDLEANEVACALFREKLHDLVDDEETAEGLEPRGYPLGCKRQVIDTDYYAAYNRANVTLVDLRRGDIEEILPNGIRTAQGTFDLDVLIYATGFDAMTGALKRIDIRGRDGLKLTDKWADGPRAYLGLQMVGFPNLFTVTGPGSPSVLSNMLVSIEQHVDFITDCIGYLRDRQIRAIEPAQDAEDAWVEHVNEVAQGTMFTAPTCNSWYLGANIPGKPRVFMPYVGGINVYAEKCREIAADGYTGFVLEARG